MCESNTNECTNRLTQPIFALHALHIFGVKIHLLLIIEGISIIYIERACNVIYIIEYSRKFKCKMHLAHSSSL